MEAKLNQKKIEWAIEVMMELKRVATESRNDWEKKRKLLADIVNELPKILRAFLYLVKDEYRGIVCETIRELAETFY